MCRGSGFFYAFSFGLVVNLLLGGFFVSRKTAIDVTSRKLRDKNKPTYRRLVAKITPLTMGPIVWPMSIVVERNPIEAPTKVGGTRSQTMGEVDESTVAKETP